MTQAAFELQRADSRVIDVALKYGYSSPTAFNRAFQNVHGITPTAAKLGGNVLQAYPSIQFKIEITGGSAMAYRIAEKPPLRIVGIRIPLTSDMEDNLRIVPEFWKASLQGKQFLEICRLSVDDDNKDEESNSITNQKQILQDYARKEGFANTMFFVDDGVSGTTFQRPNFMRMERMAENGEIGTIIVKDLSRFGREQVEMGRLTQVVYPSLGIRFIAIQEPLFRRLPQESTVSSS